MDSSDSLNDSAGILPTVLIALQARSPPYLLNQGSTRAYTQVSITTNTHRTSRSRPSLILRWTPTARQSCPLSSASVLPWESKIMTVAAEPAAFAITHSRPVVRSQKFRPSSPTSICTVCSQDSETGLHGHRAPHRRAAPAQPGASTTRTWTPDNKPITNKPNS